MIFLKFVKEYCTPLSLNDILVKLKSNEVTIMSYYTADIFYIPYLLSYNGKNVVLGIKMVWGFCSLSWLRPSGKYEDTIPKLDHVQRFW